MSRSREYLKLYKTARWQRRRDMQLQLFPLCAKCAERGVVTPAEVAHHKIPHKGDLKLFWFGELESLCTRCHDGITQQQERFGFCTDIGVDGWPVDQRHPCYAERKWGY